MAARHALPALFVAISLAPSVPQARGGEADFRTVAIFPPESKHNHSSCVVELAGGDLLATWYRGSGERKADDVQIMGARLAKGATQWSPTFLMADTPDYPDCNPALFAAPDRTIWLFYPTILDHHWEGALLKFAVARDDGTKSGPPAWFREGVVHVTPVGIEQDVAKAIAEVPGSQLLKFTPVLEKVAERSREELYQRLGWMPRVHPIALPSGRWLLPLYCDTFSASIVVYSDDRGATWKTGRGMFGYGNIQPSIVRKNDGTLVAYMRDNGPFHYIRVSTSRDDGVTWSKVTNSTLPNPGAGVEAVRLADGRWMIVYNDSQRGRHTLAVSLSDDEGATWKWTRHVEQRPAGEGSFHYPSLLQTRDGRIHLTYTHNTKPAGNTIQHTSFSEAWVLQGDPPAGR